MRLSPNKTISELTTTLAKIALEHLQSWERHHMAPSVDPRAFQLHQQRAAESLTAAHDALAELFASTHDYRLTAEEHREAADLMRSKQPVTAASVEDVGMFLRWNHERIHSRATQDDLEAITAALAASTQHAD